MSESYCVVLADPGVNAAPQSAQAIGQAISRATGLTPYDALRYGRDAMGILIEQLALPHAQAIVAELAQIDVLAGLAPDHLAPPIETVTKVRQIAITEQGPAFQTGYGELTPFPWDAIQLVGVCLHQQVTAKPVAAKPKRKGSPFGRMAAGMIGGPIGSALYAYRQRRQQMKQIRHQIGTDECYVADFFLTQGSVMRLRSNACAYNYLGGRLQQRSEWNFHQMIQDLAEMSQGQLLLSPPAQRFLEGDDLSHELVENLHDFEAYNRWLFLAAAAFSSSATDEAVETDDSVPQTPTEPNKKIYDDFAF